MVAAEKRKRGAEAPRLEHERSYTRNRRATGSDNGPKTVSARLDGWGTWLTGVTSSIAIYGHYAMALPIKSRYVRSRKTVAKRKFVTIRIS